MNNSSKRLENADESGDSLEFQKALRSIAMEQFLEAKEEGDTDGVRQFLKLLQDANKEVIRLEGQKKVRSKEEEETLINDEVERRIALARLTRRDS